MNLIDIMERPYPASPGYKVRETSRAAANEMKPKAKRLQNLCLNALGQYGPMTADECADRLQIDKLAVRPRFSELSALGKVFDSGIRRLNASGKKAVVWQLASMRLAA